MDADAEHRRRPAAGALGASLVRKTVHVDHMVVHCWLDSPFQLDGNGGPLDSF